MSETREQGADAAELVVVDYDAAPGRGGSRESPASDEVLLFPELGTNLALTLDFGSDESLFDGCEVVVRQRIVNQRIAPCPLEGRSAAARVGDDGRLEYFASTQAPHGVLGSLATVLGLEPEQVHVVSPDVGGGFGAKGGVYPEEILVAWAAMQLGRPVRWTETRSESMLGLGHGRGQVQYAAMGGNRDGKILAYRVDVVQDSRRLPGHRGDAPPPDADDGERASTTSPKAECSSVSVVTNTTPTVAYRGAGRPEATAAIERMIDRSPLEIGMDPAEVRRRNFVAKAAFPFTTPTGTEYDIGDYVRTLDLALEVAGYEDLRAEQARRRAAGDPHQLGIGLCSYVEITNGLPEGEYGAVEVRPDGKVIVRTGTSPARPGPRDGVVDARGGRARRADRRHRGHPRRHRRRAPRRRDVRFAVAADRRRGRAPGRRRGRGQGQAARRRPARGRARGRRARQGRRPVPRRRHAGGRPDLARARPGLARPRRRAAHGRGGLHRARARRSPSGPTSRSSTSTSRPARSTCLRHIAVDDAGRILNPLLAEGQVHGGIAQGAAQALLEEFAYDEQGNPLTGNFADYAFPSAAELPSYETRFTETPTPRNPLGAKGIGESGTIGSTPAVQNAVVDALAHLGVRPRRHADDARAGLAGH